MTRKEYMEQLKKYLKLRSVCRYRSGTVIATGGSVVYCDEAMQHLNYMIGAPAKQEVRYAMSNSLGFGGHNGTLLVKKYEED